MFDFFLNKLDSWTKVQEIQQCKNFKKKRKKNTTHQSIRSLEATYQRRRSDFLFMILLVWGSWMNFLSSNDIKQLSKQSQVRTKPFISPKSIRPPPSNFPVSKKSITTNNDDIIHEFWIGFLFFHNFSSAVALWQFVFEVFRQATGFRNDWSLTQWIILLGCSKQDCKYK